MAVNKATVNEVTGRKISDIELEVGSADAYGTVPGGDMSDEHTYEHIVTTTHEERNSTKNSPGKSESGLSIRIVVIATVVCVVLSAVTSIIVVLVYHNIVVKAHEETLNGRLEKLEANQNTLEVNQVNIELNQANGSRHLDTLEQNLANAVEILTQRQTTANHQLELLQERQNSSGRRVAFSVFTFIYPILNDNTPKFSGAIINTGHYNMTSGDFTCPVSGLYFFSLSFEHYGEEQGTAVCGFRVNGSGYVSVYVRDRYEVGSASIIYHLSANDVMRLFCYGLLHKVTTDASYSGFLISAD